MDQNLGVDLVVHIAQHQQQIIQASGQIGIDDPRMWRDLLDHLDNEHWELIFETLNQISQAWPTKPWHARKIQQAQEYYEKHRARSPRAMDINPTYKAPSWGCVMAIREIIEEIQR